MVGIQGLGGVPEPKSDRPAKVRNGREEDTRVGAGNGTGAPAKDDVQISSEAQAAAEVARIVQLSKTTSDIRADKVEEAKEKIARGDYKKPEVVAEVAKRVIKYLP